MKLLRLTKSEIKKMLFKPSLYIMGAFLTAVLIATVFAFNPSTLTNPNPAFDILAMPGTTAAEVQEYFDNNYLSKYENVLDELKSINNFYTIPAGTKLNEKPSFKNFYDFENFNRTYFGELNIAFHSYNGLANSASISEFNSKKSILLDKFNSMKNYLDYIFKSSHPPVALISINEYNDIQNILKEIDVLLKTETPNVEAHKNISSQLGPQILALHKDLINVENIEINVNFLAQLNNIVYNADLRMSENYSLLAAAKNADEAKIAAAKYVSTALTVERLFGNSLYLEIVKNYSDSEVNDLYGLKENPFISLNETAATFYSYEVEENIARDDYLLGNNLYDFEFNNNFSKFRAMGAEASAYDYMFFAMEIVAFFIIMCAVIIGATSISGEYASGTMKMLAIRPYSRSKILTSKFIASLVFALIFIVFTALITFLTGVITFGANNAPILTVVGSGIIITLNPFSMFLIYIATLLIKTIIYVSIAMLISVLFKNNVQAILTAIGIYLINPIISAVLVNTRFLTFIPFINIDLFKFFGGQYYVTENSDFILSFFTSGNFFNNNIWLCFSFIMIMLAVVVTLTHLVFRKRDIN